MSGAGAGWILKAWASSRVSYRKKGVEPLELYIYVALTISLFNLYVLFHGWGAGNEC